MSCCVVLPRAHRRHAHHAAVGRGRVRQGVQPLHGRPAVAALRRHAAGAQARLGRQRSLLGHRLRPPRLPQHDAQRGLHSLQGGDLRKPGGTVRMVFSHFFKWWILKLDRRTGEERVFWRLTSKEEKLYHEQNHFKLKPHGIKQFIEMTLEH